MRMHLCVLDGPFESSASPNMKINGSQGMFVFSNRSVPSITSAQNILTCELSCGIPNSIYLLYGICSSSIIFFLLVLLTLHFQSILYCLLFFKLKFSVVTLKQNINKGTFQKTFPVGSLLLNRGTFSRQQEKSK